MNPDANSVTPVATDTLEAGVPVPVGREPWAIAITQAGTVVVMNRASGSLTLLRGSDRTDVAVGPELGGLALSLVGPLAYVTVSSADEVAVVDLKQARVVERIPVGRLPWALAVSRDEVAGEVADEMVVVSHRLARSKEAGEAAQADGKEGWLSVIRDRAVSEIALAPYPFGFPNALEGLAVAGDQVLVAHLLNNPGEPRRFDSTVSAGLTAVSVHEQRDVTVRRIHLNEPTFSTPVNFPRAVVASADGETAYVVLAGADAVMGIDVSDPQHPTLIGFWPTGKNPRGIVLNVEETRAYVLNYLSRDVSVLDVQSWTLRPEVARIEVAPETLEPTVHRGSVLFNNATDPRISRLGWMSCASCHLDGGTDGTVWQTPEGHRKTMPLWSLDGTAPFHASGTRDELQDVEHDIETLMAGIGLAPGQANRLLGEPNAGRSVDLDALAQFVLRGIRVPQAPAGDPSVVARGRDVFLSAGCADCHGGPAWTRTQLPGPVGTLAPRGEDVVVEALVDVGTFRPETDVLGEQGFVIPSLLGLHAKAPYLHDGAAATLADVLIDVAHVGVITSSEVADLLSFLVSIDSTTELVP